VLYCPGRQQLNAALAMSVRTLLARMRQFRRRYIGGARPSLTAAEDLALQATMACLSPHDAEAIRHQLAKLDLVQRSPGERISALYFEDPGSLPTLSTTAPEHPLSALTLMGEASVHASVISHRGLLSSIEFGASPRKLGDGVLSVSSVTPGGHQPTAASAVNALEHGHTHG